MRITPTFRREATLMAAGAAAFGLIGAVVLHFRVEPSAAIAAKVRRAEVVAGMQLDLAMASEAQKSAVLAVTEESGHQYADEARAKSENLERRRCEMEDLLKAGGTPDEREFFEQFSRSFAELRRIDDELLPLAVRNTNLKALGLLFGPVADAIEETDAALDRAVAAMGGGREATRAASMASQVRVSVLRIQALLSPHIAEVTVERMDALESRMAREEGHARDGLAALGSLAKDRSAADVAAAAAGYGRFADLKTQIVTLSRENTNVRSVAISLGEKRKALLSCQSALAALRSAAEEDPVPDRAPVLPR